MPWPLQESLNIVRVALALALLFGVVPYVVFPPPQQPEADRSTVLQRAIWMMFLYMVLVHALSAARLYEALFFLFICLAIAALVRGRRLQSRQFRRYAVDVLARVFDWMDGNGPRLRQLWAHWRTTRLAARPWAQRPQWDRAAGWTVLGAVVAVAGWMRFYEAYVTPAPVFSDAPVNLAWMSYMANNMLYNNEVYPRGMYVFLSLVRKFTALNGVEVLVVAGPLFGLGILLSVLFFVYQATRSLSATTVAALLYGTLPRLLPLDFERLASHNSQEFGFLFVLPAAWFTHAYVSSGRRSDLYTAAAAAGIVGFTHPVPLAGALLLMAATGLTAAITGGASARARLLPLIAVTAAAGLVAVAPLALAVLAGEQWHGISLQFLTSTTTVNVATFSRAVLVSVPVAIVATGWLVWQRRRVDADRSGPLAAGAVALAAPVLYALPYVGFTNEVLAVRGGDVAALGVAVGAGLLWAGLEHLLPTGWTGRGWVPVAAVACLTAVAWTLSPPEPVRPYHYYSDEQIRTYLWADRNFVPGEWTLVSGPTGYALSVGRSYHQEVRDFLDMAAMLPDDTDTWLTEGPRRGFGVTYDYLLVIEKVIPFYTGEQAQPRLRQAAALQRWIDGQRGRAALTHVFDGEEVSVWVLSLPRPDSWLTAASGGR